MRPVSSASLGLALLVTGIMPAFAQGNPEDDPIIDEPPLAPAAPAKPTTPATPPATPAKPATPTTPAKPAPPATPAQPTAPVTPATPNTPATPAQPATPATPATPDATADNGDTVTVPRAVWEQLVRDVEDLKRNQAAAGATATTPPATTTTTPPEETPPPLDTTSPNSNTEGTSGPGSAPATRNYLLLPDISLILQAKGLLSSDKRDTDRRKLNLAEGELGIQGYVYPNVKADAFITGAPSEDEPFQFEEGYLTYIGAAKGLNINVGRKFAPFGRTGELHNHSWLYPRQLLPIRDLVSEEALVGDGVNFNYLIPTKGNLFARASFGIFSGEGSDARVNTFDKSDPFEGNTPAGPGAGYGNRFYNARLWMGKSFGDNTEVEWGASRASGTSSATNIIDDGSGKPIDVGVNGHVNLTGFDFSYRHFLGGDNKRLLLRSEYFIHDPKDLPTSRATGYYGLANYRFNRFNDIGLLYENSGFPTDPGEREKATSVIYTRQFTEQYYVRFMATQGSRPGDDSYQQFRIQFVAGLGPHTHALE